MSHVIVAGRIHAQGLEVLAARSDVTCEFMEDRDDARLAARLAASLPGADGLLLRTGEVSAQVFEASKRLKVVSRHGVGVDNLPMDRLSALGVPVAVVGDVNAVSVAEHTFYLMLTLAKQGRAYHQAVGQGDWERRNDFGALELAHKTLLLIGFGRIGRQVARRALAFDMTVLVHDPVVEGEAIEAAGALPVADWRGRLGEADVVSLHVPLMAATADMIGPAELAAMKPSAVVINAARGGLIDEAALLEALSAGGIAGAGLDTFQSEPPSPDDPLLAHPKVVLTPHSAALTQECVVRMAVASARNVLAGLDGQLDPELVVNPQVLAPGAGPRCRPQVTAAD
jgi:D-3-phosphoglycerate dehydrogenase